MAIQVNFASLCWTHQGREKCSRFSLPLRTVYHSRALGVPRSSLSENRVQVSESRALRICQILDVQKGEARLRLPNHDKIALHFVSRHKAQALENSSAPGSIPLPCPGWETELCGFQTALCTNTSQPPQSPNTDPDRFTAAVTLTYHRRAGGERDSEHPVLEWGSPQMRTQLSHGK